MNIYSPSDSEALKSQTQFAESGERKIAYRSIGSGTPIILANRFRGDLDQWDPAFLDALAKDFNVITFDYSGLGSSTGEQATDVIEMANDVKDLAAVLNLKQFVMGGWSMGGFVAQIVLTEFPELVSHAILIGTRPPGREVPRPPQQFFDNALIPNYNLENEYILFFNPKYEGSKKAARRSRERLDWRKEGRDTPMIKEQWEKLLALKGYTDDAYGTTQKMMETKIPILVLAGEDDVSFPVKDWFDRNGKFPTVNLTVLSQTGHGPQHQYPEYSAKLINDFVEIFSDEFVVDRPNYQSKNLGEDQSFFS